MRPILEQIALSGAQSFRVDHLDMRGFDAPWHYHPEYEFTVIHEGTGTRFVGDSVEPFGPGDAVLLGSGLPHFWRSSEPHHGERSRATVIKFVPEAIPAVPEFEGVARLIRGAKRGLKFETAPEIGGVETYLDFLEMIHSLVLNESRPLADSPDVKTSQRLSRACDFILANLAEPITLEQVARVAAMSPSAFSRYFKKHLRKPLTHFIAEQRTAEAARLLLETDRGIAEIAFEVGFGSLSAFNRHFQQVHRKSPREFRG